VFARIDRRRKLPVTIILRALGMNESEILDVFFDKNTFFLSKEETSLELVPQRLRGETASFEIRIGDKSSSSRKAAASPRATCAARRSRRQQAGTCRATTYGKILAHDVVNTDTGEILAKANEV
jgi:DNA-directed RNA polymerase subunit beta